MSMQAFLTAAAISIAGSLTALPSLAQPYPSQAIQLVVPFAAGSGSDNVARKLTAQVSARNPGWTFVVVNKPGANGFIGAEMVKRATPDGYTLFYSGNTTHGANSALFKSLPYDPIADFSPITRVGVFPLALIPRPSLAVDSVAQLVDLAKKEPGKLSYAAGSAGPQVAGETFKHDAKLNVLYVPYKSGPQAIADVMGGQVDFLFIDTVASNALIRDGKLKALAVTSKRRVPRLPNIPTMQELGYPNFEVMNWSAVFAPANTPAPIVKALYDAFTPVVKSAEWQKYVEDLGGYADVLTPSQTQEWIKEEIQRYESALRRAGVAPQ